MSKSNKKKDDADLVKSAEPILEYMQTEIKKWNGWSCLSISRPGSGKVIQKEIIENATKSFKDKDGNIPEPKDLPKWDDTLVPVQIHKELPVLGEDGLYRSYTSRMICFITITNAEFGGLVCDRGNSFCIGDPFALNDAAFPTVQEESITPTKQ